MLNFRENEDIEECPCREDFRESLRSFHNSLLDHCKMPELNSEEDATEVVAPPSPTLRQRLMALVWKSKEADKAPSKPSEKLPGLCVYVEVCIMIALFFVFFGCCF
jgi:hypothetical protein